MSSRPQQILEGKLTPKQAERFAQTVNVPFGYLFFEAPPERRAMPIADFRSVQEREPLGQEFFDVYDDVVYKQSWFSDYKRGIAASPLSFVGRFNKNSTAMDLAADMRVTLKLSSDAMRATQSTDDLYALVVKKAEDLGALVFKNGVVGNNTRRRLPVSQFRGFAIIDKFAPAVFVNGADAKAAWVFTLLHELAHVWLGASGVSDAAPKPNDPTEVLCNAAAAEVLVPAKEFSRAWNEQALLDSSERIDVLRRRFKVSTLVIARRALDHGVITRELYNSIYAAARKAGSASSGGDFYATLGARNGKRFADAVSTLAQSGDLGLRQAGRLLNTTPSNVLNYYDRRHAVPS
ncbi:XRE family transcriptional regulator [soil metagenome]